MALALREYLGDDARPTAALPVAGSFEPESEPELTR